MNITYYESNNNVLTVAPRAGAWIETAACGANDWEIYPEIKQLQKKIEISVNTYTGTHEEYLESHKSVIDGKEYLVLEDYLGRKWRMDRKTFDIHSTDIWKNRAERVEFLNEIASIAMDPDEVWLGRDAMSKKKGNRNLDNYFFVRHYTKKSLALRLYLKDDIFEFRSWFEVKDARVRNGILVKNKNKKEEGS